jgi:hypothetical protein
MTQREMERMRVNERREEKGEVAEEAKHTRRNRTKTERNR